MIRIAVVFLAPVLVYALPTSPTLAPTSKVIADPRKTQPMPMPDVVVTDVTVDDKCQVVAHFANRGTGPIPPEVTSLALELSGIANVKGSVPAEKLRAPGATFDYLLAGAAKATTTPAMQNVSLLARDPIMAEPDKANNYLAKSIACTVVPPGPDLALTVTTKADCTKTIELANIGDAAPDVSLWRAVPIRRRIDGMTFAEVQVSVLDPLQALAKPGGKVTWNEPAEYRAYDQFEYKVWYGPYEKGDSKANNTVQAAVPAACKAPRPPVDVAIARVTLDRACRIVAHVKNAGTTPLPLIDTTLDFYKGDAKLGSFAFGTGAIVAPGAETTGYGPNYKDIASATIKAVFVAGKLPQTRTDNDAAVASLACPVPAPAMRLDTK